MNWKLTFLIILAGPLTAYGQRVPNEVENIDYLITYGAQAPLSLGDDDHVQISLARHF